MLHDSYPSHVTVNRFFSLPQVDLMVRALEAKGERPLVIIAERYIDRVGDLHVNS